MAHNFVYITSKCAANPNPIAIFTANAENRLIAVTNSFFINTAIKFGLISTGTFASDIPRGKDHIKNSCADAGIKHIEYLFLLNFPHTHVAGSLLLFESVEDCQLFKLMYPNYLDSGKIHMRNDEDILANLENMLVCIDE